MGILWGNRFFAVRVLGLLIVLLGVWAGGAHGQSLSLPRCHELVDSTYPLTSQFEDLEGIARLSGRMVLSAFYPQFSVEGRASYQNDVTRLSLTIPELENFGIEMPSIPHADRDQYQFFVELRQLVFDGGAVRHAGRVSLARTELQGAQVRMAMDRVHEAVDNLYFGLLLVERRYALYQSYGLELTRHAERLDALVANGVASALDRYHLSVAQLEHRQRGEELLVARAGLVQGLGRLLGVELDSAVTLEWPSFPEGARGEATSDGLESAELRVLSSREALIEAESQALNAEYWPKVALFARGGYGKPGFNMLSAEFEPFWLVGASLRWDFGTMYTLSDRKELKRLERSLYGSQRAVVQRELEREYDGYVQTVGSMDRLREQDSALIATWDEVVRLTQLRVDEGTATLQDLLDALSKRERTELQKTLHELERLKASYQLVRMRGTN